MRRSHGSLSSFCSAGPPSLAPSPRPPYFVVVGSEVRMYESYCCGQFWPHTLGSAVSSVTSATRTKVCRASCFRSKMLVSRARSRTTRAAAPAKATTTPSQPHRRRRELRFIAMAPSLLSRSSARPVAGAGVAVQAVERPVPRTGALGDRVDESLVAPHAVPLDDRPVGGGDLDRLLEVLEREGRGVPEAVVGLGDPLAEARRGEMALHARRGVAVAALEPAVVLVVHDVAVHARPRIGGQVREPLGVHEGEGADPGAHADQAREDQHQGPAPAAAHRAPVAPARRTAMRLSAGTAPPSPAPSGSAFAPACVRCRTRSRAGKVGRCGRPRASIRIAAPISI